MKRTRSDLSLVLMLSSSCLNRFTASENDLSGTLALRAKETHLSDFYYSKLMGSPSIDSVFDLEV